MDFLNGVSIKRFWAVAKTYWFGDEKYGALGLLMLLGLFLLSYTGLSVVLNNQQGIIISALASKDTSRFWQSVLTFLIVLIVYTPLLAGFSYVADKLGNYWRRWLTSYFLNKYLENRSFYYITNNQEIDNPDQRISEDIRGFTQDSLKFLLQIVNSIFQIIAFSSVLWVIYKPLFFLIIAYGLIGTVLTIVIFGRPLVKLRSEKLRKEANFRFGLIHIRDNSESIAFYGGERREIDNSHMLFKEVFDNFNLLINRQFYLSLLTNIYGFLPYIIPSIVLAPEIFSGALEVGKVSESIGAFISVFTAVGFVVQQFESLTSFTAGIERLYAFFKTLENQGKAQNESRSDSSGIKTTYGERLAVRHLTLLTPNYSKTLFRDLSFDLEPGKGLLVIGASGCGKSSLLRAIAGLWDSGTGEIVRPALNDMLFLSQRSYMTLGSLRSQILYPSINSHVSDEHLNYILREVNLPNLVERFSSLDVDKNWSDILSIGEQQRIAFARLLITKPKYAILDEVTSALDTRNEDLLYSNLLNSGMTYVSVGHRPNLEKYHDFVLELLDDETWELRQGK